jgi:hypothetical protein
VLVPAAANGDLWMTFEWINKYQKSFKYHLSIIVYPFKLLVILEDRRWIKNWRHAKKYTETWEVLSITMFRYQRVCLTNWVCMEIVLYTSNCKAIDRIMCAAIFSTSNHFWWSCCKVSQSSMAFQELPLVAIFLGSWNSHGDDGG